jgi:large subunit ribosomal protein L15
MKFHELKPNKGAKHRVKRLGCGESSGHGKTSGKGNKGQNARSGGSVRPGFEGGQMPIHRRLPKKGFNNYEFRDVVAVVNLDDLEANFDDGSVIDVAILRAAGFINGRFDKVKLLGNGNLTKKLTITVDAVSASAREKIEKAGGSVEVAA